jgi:dTDP-glucose pyrophosphorylase/CBS domain-containing protein
MKRDPGPFLVRPDNTIREVMACIDANAQGIALVVDAEDRLVNTLTDGDIRRAILAGVELDLPARALLDRRQDSPRPAPLTVRQGTPEERILELMTENALRQIPVLDGSGRVVGLSLLADLVSEHALPLRAVVMAGGFGRRLRPLTEEIPKPMLPVGDRPILEHVLEGLRESGIHQVHLSTHYKGAMIADHFGDGSNFGLEIQYLEEEEPLGTAGALSLMEHEDEPVLVINGDVLTGLDFRALLDFHREHKAEMTVGVRRLEIPVPYGVVVTDGVAVTAIREKPSLRHFVNAGLYLLEPEVCRSVPRGESVDMPDLIQGLVDAGRTVVSFPVREHWLDVGRLEDYQRAQDLPGNKEEGES